MKTLRKAIFLPPNIYEKVRRSAKNNNRTLVAEIDVRFTPRAKKV